MNDSYPEIGLQALVIDVAEDAATMARWKTALEWEIPVLLDPDGAVSTQYAPDGILPDLPRFQIPIGSNLLIDRDGRIQFYSLLDTMNFDAKLIALRARLDALLKEETK